MKAAKFRYLISIIIALLIGYTVGVNKIAIDWHNFQPDIEVASKEPPPSLQSMDFSTFWAVMQKLETDYYDKTAINAQNLLNGAIVGMVNSLNDPYTVYLPPQSNTNFKQTMAGDFQGIGAELGMKNKQIVVIAPLDGSPAAKAGIKAGDIILRVNDQSTAGWTLDQTVNTIRGPKGTQVILTVQHKSSSAPVPITITRDTINVKTITTWTKPVKAIADSNQSAILKSHANDKIVYIRLSQFGDTTQAEWVSAINHISQELHHDSSIKGVVLDLRNNPGGYLPDAIMVASEFIKNGVVVWEQDGTGAKKAYNTSGKGLLTDVPLVVLINKGSASASEIVSGALRDNDRAKLVGENSFGKGIVEEAEDMGNGAGLHITIAKWLTPNGTWVGNGKNGTGLKPDVIVALDPKHPSIDTQLEKAVETVLQE